MVENKLTEINTNDHSYHNSNIIISIEDLALENIKIDTKSYKDI